MPFRRKKKQRFIFMINEACENHEEVVVKILHKKLLPQSLITHYTRMIYIFKYSNIINWIYLWNNEHLCEMLRTLSIERSIPTWNLHSMFVEMKQTNQALLFNAYCLLNRDVIYWGKLNTYIVISKKNALFYWNMNLHEIVILKNSKLLSHPIPC